MMKQGYTVLSLLVAAGIGFAAGSYLNTSPLTVASSSNELDSASTPQANALPTAVVTEQQAPEILTEWVSKPFIEQSLSLYGFNQYDLTKEQWTEFLDRSAVNYFSETYGKELLLYLAMTNEDEDLVRLLINEGADVDKKLAIKSSKYPLYYAARLSSLEIFKLLVDNAKDLNIKQYKPLLPNINRSGDDISIKKAKIDYLLSSGYELTDLGSQIIPLVTYGPLDDNPYIADQIMHIDPNEMASGTIALTTLIHNGAGDDVVMALVERLDASKLSMRHTDGLVHAALRSDNIKRGATISAILNQGIDLSRVDSYGFLSLAGWRFNIATITDERETFNTHIEKLDALLNAGDKLTNEKATIEHFQKSLEARRDKIDPEHYEILRTYLQ